MHEVLKDKKFIFFDVGYTLDAPASGHWMFTNSVLGVLDKLDMFDNATIHSAMLKDLLISKNHVFKSKKKYRLYVSFIKLFLMNSV